MTKSPDKEKYSQPGGVKWSMTVHRLENSQFSGQRQPLSRVEWFGHLLNSKRGVVVGGKMVWEQIGEEDAGGPHLLQSSNGTVIEQVVVPMVNPAAYTHPLCDTASRRRFVSMKIFALRCRLFAVDDNSRYRSETCHWKFLCNIRNDRTRDRNSVIS